MVKAQKYLLDYLGIKKLLAVTGGSMGGMQVLQFVLYIQINGTFCYSNSL